MISGTIKLAPKLVTYRLAYHRIIKTPGPVVLTHSVTSMCTSLCKTCHIGREYLKNPRIAKNDLRIDEIERVYKSIGEIYFFNISGGEPFMRKDLPQIVDHAMTYLKPSVLHTPTNALMPKQIEKGVREIMEVLKKHNSNITFKVKPSFDGIGTDHDRVRGVKGNFEKLKETVTMLKELKEEYPNLHVGLGTVISKFNMDKIDEISTYAHNWKVDAYINEIAENRTEMFNVNDDITPSGDDYRRISEMFSSKIRANLRGKSRLTRVMQAFRLVYYELASQIVKEKRQVIPCYAGLTNVHLNAVGDVWPCCTLGYDKPMGNVRDLDYDFKALWHSKQANDVRRYIKDRNCACPLANVYYSNILLNTKSMFKVVKNLIV